MINDFIYMNGYGTYVFSAFSFTIISFTTLYLVIKNQFIKEKKKFIVKFGSLEQSKAKTAKLQKINKEILSNTSIN